MSPQPSNVQPFYLTNGQDSSPLIHPILEPSSRTWQYVVIDPNTRHGVIIDPVCSRDAPGGRSSPDATDDIIRLVEEHGYHIDHILETESSPEPKLTAAWSLRMHFSNTQGYAPQLCSNSSVATLQRNFARKYGAANGFSTTLRNQYDDKTSILVGRMRVTVMHVPGFQTPTRRAYLIQDCIFGAHSIAVPAPEKAAVQFRGAGTLRTDAEKDDERRALWKSMVRVLSLPPETYVFREEASQGSETTSWTSIEHCRAVNPYTALNENEFVIRRCGETRELEDSISADSRSVKSSHKRGKKSR